MKFLRSRAQPEPDTLGRDREAAMLWLAQRERGLDADEAAEFRLWLQTPGHEHVFRQLEGTWCTLQRARRAGRGHALRHRVEMLAGRQRRRRLATVLPLLLVAGLATFGVVRWQTRPAYDFGHASISVLPDRRVLPDGSAVELNANADIAVDFSASVRAVRLLRGEALFVVQKDPARPFIVAAGSVAVRAVGTAFVVRLSPETVDVLVTEGRVAVRENSSDNAAAKPLPANAPAEVPILSAGHRVVIPIGTARAPLPSPKPISPKEIGQALAWRQQRLEFDDTPLAAAVEAFNRRGGAPQLAVSSADVGALRITGVFWTGDPEAFARALEASLGLSATANATGTIALGR